ncbi:MAG: hypothetical protein RMY34_18555 [Aulosira sp. DedQUE10]|nr:hypothetical protein [Aulosira sp. DedQUE10]
MFAPQIFGHPTAGVPVPLEHQFSNPGRTSPPTPLLAGYGVHTSLEITPNAWFRRLALGCVIAFDYL